MSDHCNVDGQWRERKASESVEWRLRRLARVRHEAAGPRRCAVASMSVEAALIISMIGWIVPLHRQFAMFISARYDAVWPMIIALGLARCVAVRCGAVADQSHGTVANSRGR